MYSFLCEARCILWKSLNKCSECQSGYQLNEKENCEPCLVNCTKHHQSSLGDHSRTILQNPAQKLYMLAQCAANCKNCSESGEGKCDECNQGYAIIENQCVQCPKLCEACDATGETISSPGLNCTKCDKTVVFEKDPETGLFSCEGENLERSKTSLIIEVIAISALVIMVMLGCWLYIRKYIVSKQQEDHNNSSLDLAVNSATI